MPAAGGEAAGHPVGGVGLLAGLEVCVGGVDVQDRPHALEAVGEGIDALGAQALELGAAVVLRRGGAASLVHGRA